MNWKRIALVVTAALGGAVTALALVSWWDGRGMRPGLPDAPPDLSVYDPQRVVPEFGANTEFAYQTAAEATWVRDDELVLGVELAGHARAYLINTLTHPHREIFNDRLGDRAIAATW